MTRERLTQLNRIVYQHLVPEIQRRVQSSVELLVAVDAINLLDSGLDQLCDRTVAVTSPLELRVRRIMARDGISEQYARLRVSAQKPDEYFRSKCSCELNNGADTAEAFRRKPRTFFHRLIDQIREEKQHGTEKIRGSTAESGLSGRYRRVSDEMKEWKNSCSPIGRTAMTSRWMQTPWRHTAPDIRFIWTGPRQNGSALLRRSGWRRRRGIAPMSGEWT